MRRRPKAIFAVLFGAVVGLIAIAGPLAALSRAQGCDETWASTATSGSWATAGNWNPASVPTGGQNVCLPAGSYTVTVTGSQNAGTLSVGAGATLALTISGSSGATLALNTNGGTSTNSGTIELTDTDASGTGSPVATLQLDTGATLTNDGTILSAAGAAGLGMRAISAQSSTSTLDNASDGTITVNQDLQVDGQSSGLLTTSGAVTIASGAKLLVGPAGGGTFDITGGTITDNGTLEQGISETGPSGNGTLNVSGGTITGAGLVTALPSSMSFTGAGSGTYTVEGVKAATCGGPCSLSGTIGSGQTLVESASNANGPAYLAIDSNVTNDGTIKLTDPDTTGSTQIADLAIASGNTLTNHGTILSDPGGAGIGTNEIGGAGTTGTLNNASDGTITVNQDLQVDSQGSGTFTTSGNVTIPSGKKLLVAPSGGGTFDIAAGTITDNGALEQGISETGPSGNGTLNVTGGTVTGAGLLTALPSSITFNGQGTGTYTVEGVKAATCGGPCSLSGTIGANQKLVESASNATGPAYLAIDSNVTNDGTIELTDPDTTGPTQEAQILIASGDTLTNDGTILSDAGGAGLGTNVINGTGANSGTLANASDGTITVNQGLQIDANQDGVFTTSGAVNIASGQKLMVDPGGGACGATCTPTFNLAGGTITDNGTFTQDVTSLGSNAGGANLNVSGGTISGPGLVVAAPSNVNFSGSSGSGTYTLEGASCACSTTLTGTISSGDKLAVNFGVAGGLTLNANPSLTNNGTIAPGTDSVTFTGDLINGPSGTIDVNSTVSVTGAGSSGVQAFQNSGTVNIASGKKLDLYQGSFAGMFSMTGGKINNQGTLVDGLNEALSNSLVVSGGTLTGNPVMAYGVGASFAGSGAGTFDLLGQFNLLSGNIGPGCTVVLDASTASGPGNALVTASTDLVNSGTIELTDPDPSGSSPATASLDFTSGTLTNAGAILSDGGQAGLGSRVLQGNVANDGSLTVDQSLQQPSGTFANAGTVMVANHQTLTVAGAFSQSAGATTLSGSAAEVAAPGGFSLSGGTLGGSGTIDGNLSNGGEVSSGASPATLTVNGNYTQSAGGLLAVTNTSTGADQLSVSGSATLGGTLQVTTAGGFTPAPGSSFQALTASSVSGTFATAATGGMYSAAYNPTNVTLTALAQGTQPSLSIGDASVEAPVYGTASMTFTVTLSGAQSSSVTVDYATADGTALANQDYEPVSGQLTFAPGETSKTVTVNAIGGTLGPQSTFFVDLSNPTGAGLGVVRGTGTITHPAVAVNGAVNPSTGGNGGDVTVTVHGSGLYGAPTVELTAPGASPIIGSNVTVAGDGSSLTATFDLTNTALGTRSVVVSEPGGSGSETIANSFTIVPANPPAITVQLAGPPAVTPGGTWIGELVYTNLGNDDAQNSMLEIDGFAPGEAVTVPPQYGAVQSDDGYSTAAVIGVPNIPAGATGAIPVQFTAVGTVGEAYTLVPFVLADSDSAFAPVAPDPTATVSDQVLSSTATTEEHLLTIASSSGGGTLDGAFTATPIASPGDSGLPLPNGTESTLANGDLQWLFTATVPPPPIGPPGTATGLLVPSVFASVARAGHLHDHLDWKGAWNKVQAVYKGATKAWDKSQTVIAAKKQMDLASQLAAKEQALTDCLANKYGLSGLQRLTAKNLASGSAAVTDFNAIQSATQKIDLNPSESIGVDLFAQIMDGAWAHFMFGGGFLNGASNNFGGAMADAPGYASLTPKERYDKALLDCPPSNPPAKNPQPPGFFQIPWGKIFFPPTKVTLRASRDPNSITGPSGPGAAHWQAGAPVKPYAYTVEFENQATATAPAYRVAITDHLPSTLDLATFSLGAITFGDHVLAPPAGVQSWTTRVDLRPASQEFVVVSAALDRSTATVTWQFTTIDAATGHEITDPINGFLPPDTAPPAGVGTVNFTVAPHAGLPSGTTISDSATITFDTNAPIATQTWVNKIDRSRPRSRVRVVRPGSAKITSSVRRHVRTHRRPALLVSWTGTEHYSGIGWFAIYASAHGGRFKLVVPQTSGRHGSFVCRAGSSYRFYTVAYSAVGVAQRGHSAISRSVRCP